MDINELRSSNIPFAKLAIALREDGVITISAYEIDDNEPYFELPVEGIDLFDQSEIMAKARKKLDPIQLAVFKNTVDKAFGEIRRMMESGEL